MTLVMAVNVGSSFTVMTSDERIAYNIQGKLIPCNERRNKIHILTDNVLFGWGGDMETALQVIDQLEKNVSPADTLETCMRHLKEITDNMTISRRSILLLSGFDANGSSGMVMKKTGEAVSELKINKNEYRYIMLPPTSDYSDKQNEFFYMEEFIPDNITKNIKKLGVGKWRTNSINAVTNHLMKLHGIISYKEPKASTAEGHYCIIYKDDEGIVQTVTGEYDTKPIHEQLKQKSE